MRHVQLFKNVFSYHERWFSFKRNSPFMFRVKANTVNPIFEETVEYFLPHYHLGNHKIEAGHRVHTVHTLLFSRASGTVKRKLDEERGRTGSCSIYVWPWWGVVRVSVLSLLHSTQSFHGKGFSCWYQQPMLDIPSPDEYQMQLL